MFFFAQKLPGLHEHDHLTGGVAGFACYIKNLTHLTRDGKGEALHNSS
jgi:hypothetical protein